jgi:hypothetical protein
MNAEEETMRTCCYVQIRGRRDGTNNVNLNYYFICSNRETKDNFLPFVSTLFGIDLFHINEPEK